MERNQIYKQLEETPVILGVTTYEDFPIIRENDSTVVFVLFGTISNIVDIVAEIKSMGKLVFVNIDMIDGFSAKPSVIDFVHNNTLADGIISAKPSLLHYAKSKGLFTVHRFFILDSSSWRSIERQIEISKADIINLAPGWTKVISWTTEKFNTPVVASGLVCDKQAVIECLKAGAIAICTTNHGVWEV